MDNGTIPKHLRLARMSRYYPLMPFTYKKVIIDSPVTSYKGKRHAWDVYYNNSLVERFLTLKEMHKFIKEKAEK